MLSITMIFIFLTFIINFYLFFSYIFKDKIKISFRLNKLKKNNDFESELNELNEPFYVRVIKPAIDNISDLIAKVTPSGMRKRVEEKLNLAGRPYNLTVNKWFMFKLIIGVILPLILLLLLKISGKMTLKIIFFFGFISLFFNVFPNLLLTQYTAKRKKEITDSLPDVLDLITVSVEAGLSFDGALIRLVDKMSGILVDEFNKVLNETRMGKSRKKALRDMSVRCGVSDITTLVGAIIQADELGVSITNVLRIQSKQMRNKRRQRAQEKAMKAPVKMLFPLMIFIFPAIFAVLLGPAIIRMITEFTK